MNGRFAGGCNAFSLVELAMAMAIAAFALLAIFGLLPIGISNNQSSIQQSAAANLATNIIADLNQTPTAAALAANNALSALSPRYGISVTARSTTIYLDQSGGPYPAPASPTGTSLYKAVITLSGTSGRTATNGSVVVSWPARAAGTGLGSVAAFVALDRN